MIDRNQVKAEVAMRIRLKDKYRRGGVWYDSRPEKVVKK